ncbi:DNA-directed RNA polymerase III subunit RPC8 isoform X2 [Pteropus alecto]|uniref:DNA-directed RNA polymerase III subunit RPC8 isoform X2 n=1 Tax=Pteropus alecto TaxID=9402 RepID=UPI00076860F2|nr:DNA-directed RNA polymerase III subunit RPC8 isoform X2 [Pteropus alecto]
MFVLVEMVDTVRTPPWQFERKLNDSIAEELNKKLANKVVYNVGLCICLFDITKLEDAYVFPGDGASHTKVHFRYVVFHPFLDEILIGKIKGCSPEGVHESLQQPAKFDEAEQVWVWEYETEEGAHDLYMDTGEEIRFRVVDESFVDTSPSGPSSAEATASSEELPKKEAPYTLVVRDPSVSRAWAFFPGGPAASPGLDSGLVRRPHPSPPGGAMTTACAQGSWRAGAESALPACLLPHHPGLGPLPKVLLSVTTKTVFNKQWQHQLGNHCLNGHQVTNLPHLGQHVLPLPNSLAETAPPQTAGLGGCVIQAASDRALSRLSLVAP